MPDYPNPEPREVTERNKAIMRKLLVAYSVGDTTAIDLFFDPNIVTRSVHPIFAGGPPGATGGLEALKKEMVLPMAAFPDGHFKEEYIIGQGDMVVLGWHFEGTYSGELYGKQGTGARVAVDGAEIARFRKFKVIEHWDHFSKPRLESLVLLQLLDEPLRQRLQARGMF